MIGDLVRHALDAADLIEHLLRNGHARCRRRCSRRRHRSAARARSKPLSPTVEAAATRRRPSASLQALGCCVAFSMSLTVIEADAAVVLVDDQQLLDAVLMQQALGLVLADALAHRDELLASSARRPAGADRRRSARRDWSECRRGAPACPPAPRSTTGMPEMPCAAISASASASVSSGKMVIGSTTMPLSKRLTLRTSSACSVGRRDCGG